MRACASCSPCTRARSRASSPAATPSTTLAEATLARCELVRPAAHASAPRVADRPSCYRGESRVMAHWRSVCGASGVASMQTPRTTAASSTRIAGCKSQTPIRYPHERRPVTNQHQGESHERTHSPPSPPQAPRVLTPSNWPASPTTDSPRRISAIARPCRQARAPSRSRYSGRASPRGRAMLVFRRSSRQ